MPALGSHGPKTPAAVPADGRHRPGGPNRRGLFPDERFVLAVTLGALLYVAAAWSPSSYGHVLDSLGVEDPGSIFGVAQEIRSDEFAIWTPTLQALVRTDFRAINETSLYREEFRSLSSMPIRDWGIVFKPQFWPFFVLSPARAYSAYHAFHAWALLVGWSLFLRRLGVTRLAAALAALVIFASPWSQAWWTSLAPILAWAPWYGLLLLASLPSWLRLMATGYLTAVWLLDGLFYPPLILVSALTVGVGFLVWRPERARLRVLVPAALGTALGATIAAAYLWQPLLATVDTVTHGRRSFGGGSVPWQDWLGTFVPSFPFRGWTPLYGINVCESSAAGSALWLLILAFTPLASWRAALRGPGRSRLIVGTILLSVPMALVSAWMLLPIPAAWGKPLLWHLLPASRLLLVPGLLSLLLALLWLRSIEMRWSWPRALLLSLVVLVLWRVGHDSSVAVGLSDWRWWFESSDLILLPLVFLLPAFQPVLARFSTTGSGTSRREASHLSAAAVLTVTVVANLVWFGAFNPIQSTVPIFENHDTPHLRALEATAGAHPRGWLVVGGGAYYGSILNGLGFRSVNHSLLNPQVEFFRPIFPELTDEDRYEIFGRYANIQISPRRPPDWQELLTEPIAPLPQAILVPPEPFLPPLDVDLIDTPPKSFPGAQPLSTRLLGASPELVELEVVGPIRGLQGDRRVLLHVDPPARQLVGVWRVPVPGSVPGPDLYSKMVVRLRPSLPPSEALRWCVAVVDPATSVLQGIGPMPADLVSSCVSAANANTVTP